MGAIALYKVFYGISIFIRIVNYIILAYCVMSWFVSPTNRLYVLLRDISQPIIAPFRALSYKLMMRSSLRIDLSPWFALLALNLLQRILWWVYSLLAGF